MENIIPEVVDKEEQILSCFCCKGKCQSSLTPTDKSPIPDDFSCAGVFLRGASTILCRFPRIIDGKYRIPVCDNYFSLRDMRLKQQEEDPNYWPFSRSYLSILEPAGIDLL